MSYSHLPETELIVDGSKPVRVGVYKRQVFIQGARTYNKWDGTLWLEGGYHDPDNEEADARAFKLASLATKAAMFQNCMGWCGLAEEPKQ